MAHPVADEVGKSLRDDEFARMQSIRDKATLKITPLRYEIWPYLKEQKRELCKLRLRQRVEWVTPSGQVLKAKETSETVARNYPMAKAQRLMAVARLTGKEHLGPAPA